MSSSSGCWEHLVSGDSENSAELHRSVVHRQYLVGKEMIIHHFLRKQISSIKFSLQILNNFLTKSNVTKEI